MICKMEYLPPFICLINRGSWTSRSHQYKSRRARGRLDRAPGVLPNIDKEVKTTKFYTSKPTWYAYPEGDEQSAPRDKHATISVLKFKASELSAVDAYLGDCEQRFSVKYLKRNTLPAEQAWKEIMASTNAQYFPQGKNTVLECLQFGGNREFWDGFASEQDIARYFAECYRYAVEKIGFLHTHENILCAAIISERIRRNLFVWYLPITETWTSKVMSEDKSERGHRLQQYDEYGEPVYCHCCEIDEPRLSSSAFWKARGGLTSYSDLQEDFFNKISCMYGAVRGESKSLLKNTNAEQAKRFARANGDLYDESPPFDDMPY